ncbi:MAG: hypothetical protein KVP17_001002 [Porospora cf. gigantea B]|uniref:uncharacterized protein n=1 Tax=Porospora cf. gigantea B TaxID=2853592 RepID=UPI003571AC50|nr:MAG: hypothetical protein KVP17_001002 [Porospora cf. gigantea B]
MGRIGADGERIVFKSRRQREQEAVAEESAAPPVDPPAKRRRQEADDVRQHVVADSSLEKLRLIDKVENTIKDPASMRTPMELEMIKKQYLGISSEIKKIQKPSEKFRTVFNFEWDAADDTQRADDNPLYQNRLEPQLLFGRGYRAGIDIREQRKKNSFYDKLVTLRDVSYIDKRERSRQTDNGAAHWSEKKSSEMTGRDWRIFREDQRIVIRGGGVPPPFRFWAESGLPSALLKVIKEVGYEAPTPIQMQAIPTALQGRDIIGLAETGSGKTAAFAIPLLTYVSDLPRLTSDTVRDGPYALVLAPSRELAIQIEDETVKFSKFCTCVRVVCVVGGRSVEVQGMDLRRGAEVVIGTPGRIRDVLENAWTVLNQCYYVVMDEADRMIDLGFENDVNFILDEIPEIHGKEDDFQASLLRMGVTRNRVTQMFTATMSPSVEGLARKYLKSPVIISIGEPGSGVKAIEQQIIFCSEAEKRKVLTRVLNSHDPPVMIFVRQKKVVDVLVKSLRKAGFSTVGLHGGKTQEVREDSLARFKSGGVGVLVATDVAGRGIDVDDVQLVVNFDMPREISAYTHRIGRTGRAGKKGKAVSFVTSEDEGILYDLR